ncbi:MAG: SH3 domain-containing protein [Chloroflexi bacterium]|nr:MAG: SH3 domain-containing protein [Chloroflexota bacterium]
MRRRWVAPILLACLMLLTLAFTWLTPVEAGDLAQLPTISIATVTGTPAGPVAIVVPGNEPQINLRSGPGSLYDRVGVLLVGQTVPAKGRSPKGEWILVDYPGVPGGQAWVYALYVEIKPKMQLPIVEPPPTPTLAQTATIDPTLAARFVVTLAPTRLPTFTPPPPLAIPTFMADNGPSLGRLPMGFIIMGLAALGVFFGIVAFAQGR